MCLLIFTALFLPLACAVVFALPNNETLAFVKINKMGHRGTGGQALTGVTIAGWTTIYGRWDSVKLANNYSSAIVYFGE